MSEDSYAEGSPAVGDSEVEPSIRAAGGLLSPYEIVRREPELLDQQPTERRFTVRIELDGACQPIWRRLTLSSHMSLDRLHTVLQVAMGWTDSHLHQFIAGPGPLDRAVQPFLNPFDVMEGEVGIDEADVRLDQVLGTAGDQLHYEYDYGDGWQHTIQLEEITDWAAGEADAACLAGESACPPEDCGGIGGHAVIVDLLAGRTDTIDPEWAEDLRRWLPPAYDPDAFDADEVNDQLGRSVMPPLEQWHPMLVELLDRSGGSALSPMADLVRGATRTRVELTPDQIHRAVERYVVLLQVIGEGITLTGAGYLPPTTVRQLYVVLGISEEWIGRGNREDATQPVLGLRTSATALGLLRKTKGRLLPTAAARKLAGDHAALWRHIRDRLPLGRPHERDAGALLLLNVAAGDDSHDHDDGDLLGRLGWRVRGGTLAHAALDWRWPTAVVLEQLAGGYRAEPTWQAAIARALLIR